MPRGVMNIHTAPCLGKVLFASCVAAVHEIKRVVEMDSGTKQTNFMKENAQYCRTGVVTDEPQEEVAVAYSAVLIRAMRS